jgi:hypothetical protein
LAIEIPSSRASLSFKDMAELIPGIGPAAAKADKRIVRTIENCILMVVM